MTVNNNTFMDTINQETSTEPEIIAVPFSTDLLEILQHSLGVDRYGCGNKYRNRFVTDQDGSDGQKCERLVRLGFMKNHGRFGANESYNCYTVTAQGIEIVDTQSESPPKLSRGQKRYRAYLNADSNLTFGEWLKSPYSND